MGDFNINLLENKIESNDYIDNLILRNIQILVFVKNGIKRYIFKKKGQIFQK